MTGKSLNGLHPTLMRPRVEALLADRDAQAMGVTVVSAFRSIAHQTRLWLAALVRYGTPARARRWVAPPGKSNHGPKVDGFGTAVDFGIRGVQAVKGQWPPHLVLRFDAIAARHGLYSPMEWEDWHFEPIPGWAPPHHSIPPMEDDMPWTDTDSDNLAAVRAGIDAIRHEIAGPANKNPRLVRILRAVEALKTKVAP